MNAAAQTSFLTVQEYLEGEEQSEVRHEYIGGVAYAMAGGTLRHNEIAGSIYMALRTGLRGSRCRASFADVKVQLNINGRDIFYYPDVFVTCGTQQPTAHISSEPCLIVEVLSETTESTDRREKFWNYIQIETLEEYILVAQDRIEVTLFRRSNQWQPEIFTSIQDSIALSSVSISLAVKAIYEGIQF